ncbi:Chromosome partition protein Smc [Nymphon striatum]|nr:Chromosome partition protein Smc [Nymphon striatum]
MFVQKTYNFCLQMPQRGARSPSMVGQGRIGELISANRLQDEPLLEEAAGISGLHSRRHEAELRLRAAETNLERLDDVANRYRNLSGEIRKTEALLFHLRWVAAKASESEAESALSACTLAMGERAEIQANFAKIEAIASQKLPALREAEAASAAVLQRLQIAKGQVEEEVARLEGRKNELESRLTPTGKRSFNAKNILLQTMKLTITTLDGEQAELEEASRRVGETEAKSKEELSAATDALDENARRTQLQRTLEEAQTRKQRIEDQTKTVEADLATIVPAAKQEEVTKLEALTQTLEAALLTAEEATQFGRTSEQAARGPLEKAEGNLREIETEARTLRQI